MISVFSGDDIPKKRAAYEKFLKSLPKELDIFPVSGNEFDKAQIESFYSGSGLFFNRCAVIFKDGLERKESAEFLMSSLEKMTSSENIFIFLEGKLLKPVLGDFKKAGAEISVFEAGKTVKKEKFNSFTLANAFGSKDKLSLWMNFRQAMENEIALEELSGILFWKAKDMLLKRSFGKFTERELQDFVSDISCLLPEARRKGRDAETAFEQFLLERI